jgi:tyrosine-protein phosphatase SIW14
MKRRFYDIFMKFLFKNIHLICACLQTIGIGFKLTVIHTIGLIWGAIEICIITVRQKFFKDSLPNYGIVDPEALHRGGQPDAMGLEALETKGIKTVIHLRDRKMKNYHGNLKRVVIPFNPYQPKDEVVINFLKVIGNHAHHPVFVHCFHGADRTGMLCAIYRIVFQQWDKEKAIAEMRQYGFHFWHKNLIDYIRNLDIESIKRKANLT